MDTLDEIIAFLVVGKHTLIITDQGFTIIFKLDWINLFITLKTQNIDKSFTRHRIVKINQAHEFESIPIYTDDHKMIFFNNSRKIQNNTKKSKERLIFNIYGKKYDFSLKR